MSKLAPFVIVASLMLLTFAAGCSNKSRDTPDLGQVRGQVSIDGKPLPDVSVFFTPENGRTSTGMTDKDGKYELTYLPNIMGAKVGKHKVSIDSFINDDTDREAMAKRRVIPAKYNAQTTLSADVQKGANVLNFELKSE